MNWMSAREFLRGGYKTIQEPTVISNHGRPMFTVWPYGHEKPAPVEEDRTVVRTRTSRR